MAEEQSICKHCGGVIPPSGRGHASKYDVLKASRGEDPWEYQCASKVVDEALMTDAEIVAYRNSSAIGNE